MADKSEGSVKHPHTIKVIQTLVAVARTFVASDRESTLVKFRADIAALIAAHVEYRPAFEQYAASQRKLPDGNGKPRDADWFPQVKDFMSYLTGRFHDVFKTDESFPLDTATLGRIVWFTGDAAFHAAREADYLAWSTLKGKGISVPNYLAWGKLFDGGDVNADGTDTEQAIAKAATAAESAALNPYVDVMPFTASLKAQFASLTPTVLLTVVRGLISDFENWEATLLANTAVFTDKVDKDANANVRKAQRDRRTMVVAIPTPDAPALEVVAS